MTENQKANLRHYLQGARDAMLWKLDGLSEYDARRPLTPTGTSLLGLVKHLAGAEHAYFGETFGRAFAEPLPWSLDEAMENGDMWAKASESREQITGLYRRVWAEADATITELPLDAIGHVPWWPAGRNEVTLHRVLVHVISDTQRHAGHADILRELIDGSAGLLPASDNLPSTDPQWWQRYRDRVEEAARQAERQE